MDGKTGFPVLRSSEMRSESLESGATRTERRRGPVVTRTWRGVYRSFTITKHPSSDVIPSPPTRTRSRERTGGVVVRRWRGGFACLLVTASSDRSKWILPKGSLEEGETPVLGAQREIEEEAGVKSLPVMHLGVWERSGRVESYHLFRYVADCAWAERGLRDRRWVPLDEAGSIVPRKLRKVLDAARASLSES